MSSPFAKSPYAGYRFPPEVISQAVWLYFRFPLSLRMGEEMLAGPGDLDRAIPDSLAQSNAWRRRHPLESQQTAA